MTKRVFCVKYFVYKTIIITMDKTNFSDLAFFAKHFNMDVNKLSWCILEDRKEDYTNYLLGIMYGSSKIAISVEECCLRRLKRNKLIAHKALFSQNKQGFKVKSTSPINRMLRELIFTKRDLENLYRDKWYDETLETTSQKSVSQNNQ